MVRGTGKVLGGIEMTVPQLRLLNEVDAAGGLTVLHLAERLKVTPSTVTISVDEGGMDYLRRTLPHLTRDELSDLVHLFTRLQEIDERLTRSDATPA